MKNLGITSFHTQSFEFTLLSFLPIGRELSFRRGLRVDVYRYIPDGPTTA